MAYLVTKVSFPSIFGHFQRRLTFRALMVPVLSPTPENLRFAAIALRAGKLVGMPTETVYGLAGNALDTAALARIFEVKRRPFFDPLIVHAADAAALYPLIRDIPEGARLLMQRFWPGPLTLVLPKTSLVPDLATSGLSTVAVRVPAHPVARALLRETGLPLAAPSANPFGALSPTTAQHVSEAFEEGIECVLDGGACVVGVESSVLAWVDGRPALLRAGGIPVEALEEALGERIALSGAATSETAQPGPGMLPWHYAPRAPLALGHPWEIEAGQANEGLLWYGSDASPTGYALTENLSPSGDLREAAANLFAALHRLDDAGLARIRATRVPDEGLGRAINERLEKASKKK
jgi:L-threonylcarbamoyladenylate synthase